MGLVSIRVLAGRTTALDVWTPILTSNLSLRNNSLRARNKVAHVELLQGLCRDMLWKPITQDTKRFSVLRKQRAKLKTKNITTTFGKLLFLTQYRTRHATYIPPNTNDLVRASKQLPFVSSTETFNGNQA